jgi:L-cystine transport system substrate-binding protein
MTAARSVLGLPGACRLSGWARLTRRVTRRQARIAAAASLLLLFTALTACVASPTPAPLATLPSTPVSSPVPALTPTATPAGALTPTPAQPSAPTAAPTLRVGVDAANRPWCYRDAAGELVGLDVDLITALAGKMGVRVEYVNTAPHLLLAGLAAKRYDLAAAGLVTTPERQSEAALSEPYFTLSQAVVVRATDPLTAPVALAGKPVGVQIGSPAVAEALRLGVTVRLYDDLVIALGALTRGEVLAVIGDDLAAADYLAAHPEARLRQAGAAFAPAPVVLAVARDQAGLLVRVNAGLAALRQSGALDQLSRKWLR